MQGSGRVLASVFTRIPGSVEGSAGSPSTRKPQDDLSGLPPDRVPDVLANFRLSTTSPTLSFTVEQPRIEQEWFDTINNIPPPSTKYCTSDEELVSPASDSILTSCDH